MINFYFKEWMELNDPYWTKNFYFYEQTYDCVNVKVEEKTTAKGKEFSPQSLS